MTASDFAGTPTNESHFREVAEQLAEALSAEAEAEQSHCPDPASKQRIEECRAAVDRLISEYHDSVNRWRDKIAY
jgi:hypothetical protein